MTVDEELSKARELRKQNCQAEALEIALRITAIEPANADAWWIAGLAAHSLDRIKDSLSALREMLKHAPRFASGWAQYGVVLGENGQLEEAKKAFNQAIRIDPQHVFAHRQAARICELAEDRDGQIRFLNSLDSFGKADSADLNRLGIAHWEKKHFAKAIEYYLRSAAEEADPAPYFNLALVYNHSEVSQDVDAVDSLNRALALNPDYHPANKKLAEITPRLRSLAYEALKFGETLLAFEEWFQFYLNPFELLGATREQRLEDFDSKTIQKLKKRLLQEIDLEDGHIEHLNGFCFDRSQVIGVCEELTDENIKSHHWLVFKNPFLLWFLTRGDLRHFVYRSDYSPLEVLEALDSPWSGFKEWLSKPFAKQYNLVLSRAMQKMAIPVIESLFDGRRWTLRCHEDICFDAAHRHVDRLLEPLKEAAKAARNNCPSLIEIEQLVIDSGLSSVINLLPEPFREKQAEAVRCVRDIAIACYNEHGESDLSKSILLLSKKFTFKSTELHQRLEQDFLQIQKLIAEERKHDAKLTLGGQPMQITKEGVRMGECFLAASKITSIRWGILITGYQHAPVYEFLMVFRDDDFQEAVFSWRSSSDLKKQEAHFNQLVEAAMNYIVPKIFLKVQNQLANGEHIRVGKCTMIREGVAFDAQGWFSNKKQIIPWQQVGTEMRNGILSVFDRTNPKMRIQTPLRESENAIILRIFASDAEKNRL